MARLGAGLLIGGERRDRSVGYVGEDQLRRQDGQFGAAQGGRAAEETEVLAQSGGDRTERPPGEQADQGPCGATCRGEAHAGDDDRARVGPLQGGDRNGLVERLLLEIEVPGPGLGWRERLSLLAQSRRVTARRHPDLFLLLFQRPAVYGAPRAAGVQEEAVPRAERPLSMFMLGFAASEPAPDVAYAERLVVRILAERKVRRGGRGPRAWAVVSRVW